MDERIPQGGPHTSFASLHWLPAIADFRAVLRAALAERSPAARLMRLAALANHRLGFVESLQLDRAVAGLPAEAREGWPVVRLAVLAATTVDHLCPAVRVAGLRRNLMIDTLVCGYGQYRQELLDSSSAVHRFAPHAVLFSLTARETLARAPVDASRMDADAAVDATISELSGLWHAAQSSLKCTVLQQTYLDVSPFLFGSFDRQVPGAPARLVAHLNNQLAQAAQDAGVLLIDAARAAARDGIDVWFDEARWLQGKLEIAPNAAAAYGELVARVLAAQRGLSRKCLVLDLDNTLWGGVVGDDGVEGIVLGEGSAAGEAFAGVQRYVRQLKERGIIIAVCSKNDPAVAESAFRSHPEMVLKRENVAAFAVNWQDKAENLQGIARQLNIGLDALVFLDDNPVERARIRESLPMVAVPELPADPALFVRALADSGSFEAVSFTTEDRQRADQYAANAQREALLGASESVDQFLRGLDMSLACAPFAKVDLPRLAQLINKTNQFNTTTRRYTPAEVAAVQESARHLTLQVRLTDKFGDNGLVSALIAHADPRDPTTLDIDLWVMSCRVFGRQLEHETMNIVVELAQRRGVRTLTATYIPTARNSVIRELFPSLGFSPMEDRPADGATRWRLDLAGYRAFPTHIARRSD